jgi:hypothetical protein
MTGSSMSPNRTMCASAMMYHRLTSGDRIGRQLHPVQARILCHNSAGANRDRWPTFVVAITVSGAFSDTACAAKIMSPSIV